MSASYLDYEPLRSPPWMKLGPLGRAWTEAHAIFHDVFADSAREATKARFVADGPDDALPYSAAERGLEAMPGETPAAHRARLLGAFDAWQWGGTAKGVVDNLLLTGLTNVYERDYWAWPDGNLAEWARFWVVIDQPHDWSPPVLVGSFAVGDGTTVGISGATRDEIERLQRTIRNWKGAHAHCVACEVIFSGVIVGGGWTVGDGTVVGGDVAKLEVRD